MNLSHLLDALRPTTEYQSLLSQLSDRAARQTGRLSLNLLGAARAYLLAALQADVARPILAITPKPEHALQLFRQLSAWAAAPDDVFYFPEPENLPFERASMPLDTREKRLRVLQRLSILTHRPPLPSSMAGESSPIIVACARAVMQQTLAPTHFQSSIQTLRPGESYPLTALLSRWQQLGYEPVTVVEQRGQFSQRGGIVDIWSPGSDLPVRIEFFGDEIDLIRQFDLVTQRSKQPLDQLVVLPASEALPQFGREAAKRLSALMQDGQRLSDHTRRDFEEDLQALNDRKRFREIEMYLPYLDSSPHSLLDYFPQDALMVSDDWQPVETAAHEWEEEVEQLRQDAIARVEIPSFFAAPVIAWPAIVEQARHLFTHLDFAFGLIEGAAGRWDELFHSAPRYGAQMLQAVDDWQERLKRGEKLVVVSRQAERTCELMRERGLHVEVGETVRDDNFNLLQGVLIEGFEFSQSPLISPNFPSITTDKEIRDISANRASLTLVILSDAEIFGYTRLEARRPAEKRAAPMESFYADLSPGDFVVHIEHGIARYAGLVRRDFNDGEREYLQLNYAEGDKLFVPIYQADRVARYVGSGEREPILHRLGTTDWDTAKAKAKRAVDEIADELMELYAKRAHVSGHAFAPDTNWQQELENSFAYLETPDQLRALAAIKQDMEAEEPMDRLICGDVGYGKTEVALRAAFKAVMDNKQVAMLVPTTVLAEQHLKTFQQRLQPFPVEVEMLSRFRTEAQQHKILERMRKGGVDIVIGTHRLLQDDVQFKDLGLLVIDEEQRFGVKAKEKIKQLRTEVDVLTLTATPIPRTLQMALMGSRDMSTIDTPPEERLPIRTYVTHYDEAIIKHAIMRELGRGGQVFFVHNRVQGIEHVMARLKKLVPEARVACGHGQMRERELERVMLDFGEGKYDVLVCTAIIESGIDLPNVNTIIINRADQFGLADLYQLRGRVGRGTRQAYAYLLYSRDKVLLDVARKRLQAIFEASELGAGFKIAMRDLEIRGAGEILGAKQHGHIAAVGFDMYTKLLAQAVRERSKSQIPKIKSQLPTSNFQFPTTQPTIDLPLEAHLPKDYVPNEELRLRLYRRMAELTSVQAIDDFQQELADRFGSVPEPALNLLFLLRVKVLAVQTGVDSIVNEEDRIVMRVRDRKVLLEWRPTREVEGHVNIGRNTLTIRVTEAEERLGDIRGNQGEWMPVLEEVLKELAGVVQTS